MITAAAFTEAKLISQACRFLAPKKKFERTIYKDDNIRIVRVSKRTNRRNSVVPQIKKES